MDTCKLSGPKPLMIAHRGVSKLERENTCAAFVAAGNRSYFGIETDVRRTGDGKYIIYHDANTARLSGKDLVVEETAQDVLRQLQLFDVKTKWPRKDLCPPTLEEYLSVCKKYEKVAVLELKNTMPAEAVAEIAGIVEAYGYMESTIFISFSLENLAALRERYPDQPAQYLKEKILDPDELLAQLKKYRLDLDAEYTTLTPELVAKLHSEGIKVNAWTVDIPEEAEKLTAMGVDYITSNILE